MQTCADQTGLSITEAHHLPGTSKWNRIKHRLFAFITQNWRGKPLLTHQVITQLIASMVPGLVTATHRMSTAERQEGTAS